MADAESQEQQPVPVSGPISAQVPGPGAGSIWPAERSTSGPSGCSHSSSRTVNVAIDLAVEVELSPSLDSYVVIQGESMVEADSAEGLVASEESALVGLIASELGLPPVKIRVRSASPRGGGLGASSALAVALIAASESYLGRPASGAAERSALARDLEARLMGLPTGTQDHYPALLGGVLEVEHRAGR